MKKSTINKVISKKLNEWLSTVSDEQLRKDLRKGLIVSGGSIASMFLGEEPNDFDIYLSDIDLVKRAAEYYTGLHGSIITSVRVLDGRNKMSYIKEYMENDGMSLEDFNLSAAHRHVCTRTLLDDQIKLFVCNSNSGGYAVSDGTKESIKEYKLNGLLEDDKNDTESATELAGKYLPSYFSPNAISLTDKIQIVLRFYGDHQDIHRTFDFIHATNYFTFETGVVTNNESLECLLSKTLIYQGSLYPLTSIIRSKKFLKRGFRISAGEYLKIMFQISQLDLTNIDVLEEQLVGVDVAYFDLLIKSLRDFKYVNGDIAITSDLLNTLIDKVFNAFGEEGEESYNKDYE